MLTNVCVHTAENIYGLVSPSLKTFDFLIYRHVFLSLNCVSVLPLASFPIFILDFTQCALVYVIVDATYVELTM